MAWLQDWAYSLSDEGIWVHLYGSNELTCDWQGAPVRLQQETDYPWDGTIKIRVDQAPAARMALKLRIPGWTASAALTINGKPLDAQPGSYASLERRWSAGDVIELNLEMAPKLIVSHPMIEETRNQVAVVRGPMVYCVEQSDVPDDVPLHEVALPVDATLQAYYDCDLMGGVVAISTLGLWRPSPDFDGGLYAPARAEPGQPIDVRFVPYYAWWNRGNQAMSVWVPRA